MECRRIAFIDDGQLRAQAYVSSDLTMMIIPAAFAFRMARDLRQVDLDRARVYRVLDPQWYAWLHRRMDEAKALHLRGEITADAWNATRIKFHAIWKWAEERWGMAALQLAVDRLPALYAPPARAA